MKHVQLFKDFLNDTVNLNKTRIDSLEVSSRAIKNFVETSAYEPEIESWMEQGSWAHETIIKPTDNGEFDADLLLFVHPIDGWDAARYINELYNVFSASQVYKDKVRRWSHCVTLTYNNDKKIDVAPCVINRDGFQRLEVCNRVSNDFERTEPRAYTTWIILQNSYSQNNSFRKVTRLFKYLRDIKSTFTCQSVILTTLLGYRINFLDKGSTDFSDTPTSLKTIFGRLDDWLQGNYIKPGVTNPYLYSEDFAENWTEAQYSNFRGVIKRYREWIDDAFSETERYESIAKWRKVFGDEFAADVVLEEARSVSKIATDALNAGVSSGALLAKGLVSDLVSLVKAYGQRALPPGFDILPHMHRPKWRTSSGQRLTVNIFATLYRSRGSDLLKRIQSLDVLQPGTWICFAARNNIGSVFSNSDFEVQWRITNTDHAAADAGALRGEFYGSDNGGDRWEYLQYRGVHLVEAFVILRRTDEIVGKSAPFHVVIE